MAHTRCMLDKQDDTHASAFTRPRSLAPSHTHVHMHTRERTHTYRNMCNNYCFSTVTMIRERASLLRYTYIAGVSYYFLPLCLVKTHLSGSLSPLHSASSGFRWRNGLQIWRVTANILNKQSRTADRGWCSRLDVGERC